jgi:hypothetical protein
MNLHTAMHQPPEFSWKQVLRYGTGLFLGAGAAVALQLGLLLSAAGVCWNLTAQNIKTWVDEKTVLARATPGPKILLVGGANVFYGLRADVVEEAFGVPTVNFGIHGALPLGFDLHKIRRIAEPGDTILYVPELSNYFRDPWIANQVSLPYLVSEGQSFLRELPFPILWQTLQQTPPHYLLARFLHPSGSWEPVLRSIIEQTDVITGSRGDYELNQRELLPPFPLENPPG